MLLLRVGWIRPVPGWEGWFTFCSRRVIHLKCATTGLSVCRTQSTRSCQLCWLTASKDSLNCTGCWISPRRASAGCTWHSARCSRCTGLSKSKDTENSKEKCDSSNPAARVYSQRQPGNDETSLFHILRSQKTYQGISDKCSRILLLWMYSNLKYVCGNCRLTLSQCCKWQ